MHYIHVLYGHSARALCAQYFSFARVVLYHQKIVQLTEPSYPLLEGKVALPRPSGWPNMSVKLLNIFLGHKLLDANTIL